MKKKWKSWLLLAAPYLLSALMPVISVLFLGNTIVTDYQDKLIADRQNSLETAFERMIQKTETVEELSVVLSASDTLEQYSYACLNHSGHDPLSFMAVRDLFARAMVNPVIYDIYLFDSKDNTVISASSAAVSDMSVFFRYSYVLEGYSLPESIERLENMPRTQHYCPELLVNLTEQPNATKRIVEYRLFIPVGWVRNNQSQLIVAMDTEELFRDFRDVLQEGGEFYVYDNNDMLIYSSGSQYGRLLSLTDSGTIHRIEDSDEKLFGAVLKSRSGGWKVKVIMPEFSAEGILSVRSPAIVGFVISPVIVSILITIFFTHKNYRRILELLDLFRGHVDERETRSPREVVNYQLVQEYAGQVIHEKNRATQRMSEYAYSRKYEVLDKLVRSTYTSREEASRALAETDLSIRKGHNVVLCICFSGLSSEITVSEDTSLRANLRRLLEQLLDQRFELFDTSASETICVISMDEGESLELLVQDIVSHLNVEIAYHFGIEMLIGVGNPAETIDRLGTSYEQARAVIRYRELSGNHVNLYSELVQLEDLYFYPREYDEKIFDYVVAGKKEEAIRIIQTIYEENFVKDNAMLSLRAIDTVKNRLWDCVVSIADKYGVPLEQLDTGDPNQTMHRIRGETNARRFFALICDKVDLLAEKIQSKKTTVQNTLVKRIMEYVHENFCDRNLSLKQISTAVGVHENYVSNLFKTVYGENLSAYIENLRIEKACDLIENTSMKIEAVAETVGYTSSASFRRAFKKVKGISPVEYRDR